MWLSNEEEKVSYDRVDDVSKRINGSYVYSKAKKRVIYIQGLTSTGNHEMHDINCVIAHWGNSKGAGGKDPLVSLRLEPIPPDPGYHNPRAFSKRSVTYLLYSPKRQWRWGLCPSFAGLYPIESDGKIPLIQQFSFDLVIPVFNSVVYSTEDALDIAAKRPVAFSRAVATHGGNVYIHEHNVGTLNLDNGKVHLRQDLKSAALYVKQAGLSLT
jgi:hypothetical protein